MVDFGKKEIKKEMTFQEFSPGAAAVHQSRRRRRRPGESLECMKKQLEPAGTAWEARWRLRNGSGSNGVVKKGRHGPLVQPRAAANKILRRVEAAKTPINRPADGQEEVGPVWRARGVCVCARVRAHKCESIG